MGENLFFYICPQLTQPSCIVAKFSLIMHKSPIKEVKILSMDGSMHCLLLHMAAERSAEETNFKGVLHHYVIEEGKLHKVSEDAVKCARHLSRVQRLLG